MCGIAGVLDGDAARVARMLQRLAHRGPDGEGMARIGDVVLGHRRLAMIDRSDAGAQPMATRDGRYHLVYNGELYDDAALRARLAYPWSTTSDAETVLAAWAAWGPACVPQLDGMFAFALYDATERALYLVRDRLGVKPLAYTEDGAFASEAHALGVHAADDGAIIGYLDAAAFSIDSPFAGVHYVPPGCIVRVAGGGRSITPYWRWRAGGEPGDPSALREVLVRAVAGATRSDRPLGIFLSGGLDSSAIAALAPPELPAYTIAFDAAAAWEREGRSTLVISDDAPFAKRAAGARRHVIVPWDRSAIAEELRAIARVNDALPAWEQELTQRALARAAAADGVRGILVGDAADELFYGYHFALDVPLDQLLARLGQVPLTQGYRHGIWSEDMTATIVESWLPRLLHNGDIHAMAFGIESRVPFAAVDVIELAMATHPDAARDKAVLREALRGVLPEDLRARRKSALPKDQDTADAYRDELDRVLTAPHPVVSKFVDRARLPKQGTSEAERAIMFRVIGLHHWATAHEVTT